MRNIFDQYSQSENRLTHALVSALAEDRRLLRRFVHWTTKRRIARSERLGIVAQGFPGDLAVPEDEAERRGVPDVCIYQDDNWALLIECKLAAALNHDQLRRHRHTAKRREFKQVEVLAIDVAHPPRPLPDSGLFKSWSEVYAWLIRETASSEWARRAAEYFVAAENRLVEEGYLVEGTLTTFAGIPFGGSEPYSYLEAKRLLRLAMDELRTRRDLVRELEMDPNGAGRGAITGRDGVAVWDFLRLKGLRRGETFTRFPHLTLAIESDRLLAIVTVPHGIRSEFRRNLLELGFDDFQEVFAKVNSQLLRVLKKAKGAAPWVIAAQRRYPSQRAAAIIDARVEYDLRTAFPGPRSKSKVRPQPQWLRATYDALGKKRSNLQIVVGASFPYSTCTAVQDREILDHVAHAWLACKPLLDSMFRRK